MLLAVTVNIYHAAPNGVIVYELALPFPVFIDVGTELLNLRVCEIGYQ